MGKSPSISTSPIDYINKNFVEQLHALRQKFEQLNCSGRIGKVALSARIGKVVASHAAVALSIPAEVALIYTMHEALRGYCP